MIAKFQPKNPGTPRPRPQAPPRPGPEPAAEHPVPGADAAGTALALAGLVLTWLLLQGQTASEVGRFAAYGVGASLAVSLLLDLRRGFGNVIRADALAIAALYFLSLFEFLFPQPAADAMVSGAAARAATQLLLIGFAGLLIGRHLLHPRRQPLGGLLTREAPSGSLLVLFWAAFVLGFIYMLAAVRFDVVEMVNWFVAPRFSQPWGRGKFGDWRALLFELSTLIYLVPPLGGVILARRARFGFLSLLLVGAALLFTFFYSFSSGTRNLFAGHLVTFIIGYAFALPRSRRKELAALCAGGAVAMVIATVLMLEFRTVGLRDYLSSTYVKAPVTEEQPMLFVDYNLIALARLTHVFPKQQGYLGLEVPYLALIRPIPRALWPGKPEGLSVSIEDALGVSGMTIATTFVGEAFMSGGPLAVLFTGLFFGAVAGWWSHLLSPRNSELGTLVYASGFFAAVISMRSLFAFTTALLPTMAAIVGAAWMVRKVVTRLRQRRMPSMPAPRSAMMRR
jgi:hypothetical protein